MPHQTFNIDQTAAYLHLKREDIDMLVKDREIPFETQGGRIVFRKKDVDRWLSQRIMASSHDDLHDYHKNSSAKVHDLTSHHALIPELCHKEWIKPELHSRTRSSVIRDLVKLSAGTGLLVYEEDLLDSVQRREDVCSTAMPGGFALLHPEHHEPYMFEDSFIVVGKTIKALPFNAPDGCMTDVFFMICCQDDRIHLHVLARLCLMCQRTPLVLELRDAVDANEMMDALVQSEHEIMKLL